MPTGTLTGARRHFLFLAVREALNNAVKHARADLVRLEIHADASRILIAAEDNGCGFVPEETGIEGIHEGLENMQRRMSEIGGQFHLTSRPGGGTRVEFRVPLSVG